jgi:hypothetical protein
MRATRQMSGDDVLRRAYPVEADKPQQLLPDNQMTLPYQLPYPESRPMRQPCSRAIVSITLRGQHQGH